MIKKGFVYQVSFYVLDEFIVEDSTFVLAQDRVKSKSYDVLMYAYVCAVAV